MRTSSGEVGASQQALWNDLATLSGGAIAILAVFLALHLVKPVLFSHRTNGFWEALLAPALLIFQWLGVILPERGPWRRYTYRSRHLATT